VTVSFKFIKPVAAARDGFFVVSRHRRFMQINAPRQIENSLDGRVYFGFEFDNRHKFQSFLLSIVICYFIIQLFLFSKSIPAVLH